MHDFLAISYLTEKQSFLESYDMVKNHKVAYPVCWKVPYQISFSSSAVPSQTNEGSAWLLSCAGKIYLLLSPEISTASHLSSINVKHARIYDEQYKCEASTHLS